MNMKLRHLLVIFIALIVLCGLSSLFAWTAPSYAGGPDATPTCECTGGGEPEDEEEEIPNNSSIVGYVYDYSTGPAVPRKDVGVKLTGCSWNAVWGTDDNGYFYFNNLGKGAAYVNLQLPPGGHAINPNVLVNTSGMTETYTVYVGFYLGDTPPSGPLETPDGRPLTGINSGDIITPPGTTADGSPLPDVGGTLPDSYLVIGLSVMLLMMLPVAGLTELGKLG